MFENQNEETRAILTRRIYISSIILALFILFTMSPDGFNPEPSLFEQRILDRLAVVRNVPLNGRKSNKTKAELRARLRELHEHPLPKVAPWGEPIIRRPPTDKEKLYKFVKENKVVSVIFLTCAAGIFIVAPFASIIGQPNKLTPSETTDVYLDNWNDFR